VSSPMGIADHGDYISIPREFIAPDMVTGVHLYLFVGGRFVLYRSGHEPVDADSLGKLKRRDVENLYVAAAQREQLEDYIAAHVEQVLSAAVTPEQQSVVLRDATTAVLRSMLHRLDDTRSFDRVRHVSDLVVDRVADNAALLPGIVRFGKGQERLFTHSANVAAYAVALAARHGKFSEDDLSSIGIGALVHDVALTRVDPGLLQRPASQRTDMERDYLARHPRRGGTMLEQAGIEDPVVLDIVRNHHGATGGERPSLAAQIVQLADVFDALTNRSDARSQHGPFAALYEMRHRMDGRFSPELIRDFVLMLGTLGNVDLDSPIAPLSRRLATPGQQQSAA
jgi:HD-GYP domain-containing protein (c-di-GMP phosphodiesterase class II)